MSTEKKLECEIEFRANEENLRNFLTTEYTKIENINCENDSGIYVDCNLNFTGDQKAIGEAVQFTKLQKLECRREGDCSLNPVQATALFIFILLLLLLIGLMIKRYREEW